MDSGLRAPWMRVFAAALALVLAFAVASAVASPGEAQQPSPPGVARWDTATYAAPDSLLAFVGATVIDVRQGTLHPQQTVVVAGRRIQAVGPEGRVRIPAGARTIRADGTFMIPGLWDMHTHLNGWARHFYPFLIANGVTGIREMHTVLLDSTLRWRKEIAAGRMAGPRILTPGPALGGENNGVGHVDASTPEKARRVVDSLKAAGVDFFKAYLDGDAGRTIAREAKRVGLPIAGHQLVASASESSELGERSIEHSIFTPSGITEPCYERSAPTGAPNNPDECTALAATFRKNGTYYGWGPMNYWVDPSSNECGDINCLRYFPIDLNRYMPPHPVNSRYDNLWDTVAQPPVRRACMQSCSLAAWAEQARPGGLREAYAGILRLYHAGIPFILGSDAGPGAIETAPGAIIHSMMWVLVTNGFTPLDALRAGTWNPIGYLRATDSLGTIEQGKLADFVFLDANPLVDIYNTRRIRAVVANGRFFDRAVLDQMLIDTEERALRDRAETLRLRKP